MIEEDDDFSDLGCECSRCGGLGEFGCLSCDGYGNVDEVEGIVCPVCCGCGFNQCDECDGNGYHRIS